MASRMASSVSEDCDIISCDIISASTPNNWVAIGVRSCTEKTFNSCTSQPDNYQCLVVQTLMDNMSKNKPSTPMAHVACESKLCLVMRSSMHPCQGNSVAIGRVVMYYA